MSARHLLSEHKRYDELNEAFDELTDLHAIEEWLEIRVILQRAIAAHGAHSADRSNSAKSAFVRRSFSASAASIESHTISRGGISELP
jgi:hypothetical protein